MIQVYPNLQNVEAASTLQSRFYRTIRETMRAMAGRISGVASWEAKKLLARHIWLDAEHANAIRQRVLELRFPRVDVDLDGDKSLLTVLAKLPSTNTDGEFLTGVYRVVKPAVLEAVERYLQQSDPLDDAPSHRSLRFVVEELRDELREFELVWPTLPPADRAQAAAWEAATSSESRVGAMNLGAPASRRRVAGRKEGTRRRDAGDPRDSWQAWVRDALANAGGIFGRDSGETLLARTGFSDRPRYTIPMIPRRDPRWLPAVTQVPPRSPRTPQEQQVWVAIDHVNELWACELPAAFIWHHENMPWPLYYDTARWAYDEMRHAMLGERRLLAYGFEIGVDVPMVPDHWVGVAARSGLEGMLFVVHGLEQGGPKWKAQLKSELWKMGDPYSSQDCDYDWADESGHIRYGQDWIKALYPNLPKQEVLQRTQREVELWKEWIAEKHRSGQHGYEVFLPRIEVRCAQMPAVSHPEFFQPLGSSAATTSYGVST